MISTGWQPCNHPGERQSSQRTKYQTTKLLRLPSNRTLWTIHSTMPEREWMKGSITGSPQTSSKRCSNALIIHIVCLWHNDRKILWTFRLLYTVSCNVCQTNDYSNCEENELFFLDKALTMMSMIGHGYCTGHTASVSGPLQKVTSLIRNKEGPKSIAELNTDYLINSVIYVKRSMRLLSSWERLLRCLALIASVPLPASEYNVLCECIST